MEEEVIDTIAEEVVSPTEAFVPEVEKTEDEVAEEVTPEQVTDDAEPLTDDEAE